MDQPRRARVVGHEHYDVARAVQEVRQDYKALQDIIAILGMDELSDVDKMVVARARKIEKFLAARLARSGEAQHTYMSEKCAFSSPAPFEKSKKAAYGAGLRSRKA